MKIETVWDIAKHSEATGTAAHLLMVMALHDSGKPKFCFASNRTLAAEMNTTDRAVRRARAELLALGEIILMGEKRVKTARGRQKIPVYAVDVAAIMSKPRRETGAEIKRRGEDNTSAPPRGGQYVRTSAKGGTIRPPKESSSKSISKDIDLSEPGGPAPKISEPEKPLSYEDWAAIY